MSGLRGPQRNRDSHRSRQYNIPVIAPAGLLQRGCVPGTGPVARARNIERGNGALLNTARSHELTSPASDAYVP